MTRHIPLIPRHKARPKFPWHAFFADKATQATCIVVAVALPFSLSEGISQSDALDAIDAAYDKTIRDAVCPRYPGIPEGVVVMVKRGILKDIPRLGDVPRGALKVTIATNYVNVEEEGRPFAKARPLPDCGPR